MELNSVMGRAAEAAVAVVRGVGAEQFGLPTPCPELDVRGLVNHLVFWTGVQGYAAGARQAPEEITEGRDFTADAGWVEAYAARAKATADVWSAPEAWEGEASLTGGAAMPAAFVGGIVLGEWLLHGWDLAAATGQKLDVDDEVAAALYESIAAKADMARQHKVFGPEVPVPADAPVLDRALGLAGRDPSWTPGS
ncbi:TIGR03086 family metal-binding protein [Actinocorallia populi]|uniref:TIGR03086 family metal-binding protein n=1 Tax=Actinocorallia populi TaxID=2079200 RepID=UPI000D08AE04|nr:TIGR03086 family metal-binding protein [Actinocorallia populi]